MTTWNEENKSEIITDVIYDDPNVIYDDIDVQYGGQHITNWTEENK